MRLIDRIRALIAIGALAGAASCVPGTPPKAPDVAEVASMALETLAHEDGAGGLLDLALGFLREGDVAACCSALQSYLLQFGEDPRVRAVLRLLEAELAGG